MMGTTYIEVERPVNWRGETVDMLTYEGDVDYYEVEVEGDATFEVDYNYGADADGNRGETRDFSYVEDMGFTLYGDFRPWYVKARDYFLLKWRNRNRSPLQSPLKWTQLSTYGYIQVDEKAFTSDERNGAEEDLLQNIEDGPDPDDYYESKRERW